MSEQLSTINQQLDQIANDGEKVDYQKRSNEMVEDIKKERFNEYLQILEKIILVKDQITEDQFYSSLNKLQDCYESEFDQPMELVNLIVERKAVIDVLTVGGKTVEELEQELIFNKIDVSDGAKDMMHSFGFLKPRDPQQIIAIRVKVSDLGLSDGATTEQIYDKAGEFGLGICSAEVGVCLRLQDKHQPNKSWYTIAMQPIADYDNAPKIFTLECQGDNMQISDFWAQPGFKWIAHGEFVFRLRPPATM